MLKTRVLGLLLIIVCGSLVYYNWHQLQTEGRYSLNWRRLGRWV